MIALVEKLDGSYVKMEMGDPECGRDFCDECGDCLACYGGDPCYHDEKGHRWVIYKEDKHNPLTKGKNNGWFR